MDDDTRLGKRIAFRSTKGEGLFAKSRWTEIAVYHNPDASDGRCFIAETLGCSSREGEHTIRRRLRSDTLDRALGLFTHRSAPVNSVIEQARAWEAARG